MIKCRSRDGAHVLAGVADQRSSSRGQIATATRNAAQTPNGTTGQKKSGPDRIARTPQIVDQAVQGALTDDLVQAQAAGLLRSATDPHLLSGALIALVDGIAIRMLYTPTTEHDSLLAALDAGIDALLPIADGGNSPFTRPD